VSTVPGRSGMRPPAPQQQDRSAAAAAGPAAADAAAANDGWFRLPPQPQPPAPQADPPPYYMVDQLRQLQSLQTVWHGVGCDGCGSYPLVGRRYKCIDCPEAVGFDLCGACYDQGVAVSGRFGQHHMPNHRVEQQQQASRAELLLRSLVFG
jgi:hypothetical protein